MRVACALMLPVQQDKFPGYNSQLAYTPISFRPSNVLGKFLLVWCSARIAARGRTCDTMTHRRTPPNALPIYSPPCLVLPGACPVPSIAVAHETEHSRDSSLSGGQKRKKGNFTPGMRYTCGRTAHTYGTPKQRRCSLIRYTAVPRAHATIATRSTMQYVLLHGTTRGVALVRYAGVTTIDVP